MNRVLEAILIIAFMILFAVDIVLNMQDIHAVSDLKATEIELARTQAESEVYTIEAKPEEEKEVTVRYVKSFDASTLVDDTFLSEEYQEYCRDAAVEYGLDEYVLVAMIERESDGDAGATSSGGDVGLVQVNPAWHLDRMKKLGITDLTDPKSNILVAADYLAELLKENEYNLPLALMKYNMNHEKAEQLISEGRYSEYASSIIRRSYELKLLHEGGVADE